MTETVELQAHRRSRSISVVVVLAAFLAGLLMEGPPSQAAALKRVDVPIKLDARVVVKGTPFTVKFESVLDSRCPADVACVWAGQLEVWIRVFASGLPRRGSEVKLILHPGQPPQKDSVAKLKGWWLGVVDNGNGDVLRIQTAPIP